MGRGVERVPSSGFGAAIFMFMVGSTLTVPHASIAGHDSWISIILGMSIGIIFALIYARLCSMFPGRSLVEIGGELFGQWAAFIFGLLYAWYGFHLGILVLRNFTQFITIVTLPNTPPVVVAGIIMMVVLWASSAGIEVICRCSIVLLALVVFEFIVSVVLMSKDFELGNFLPPIDRGWLPILKGTTEIVGFPFGETVLFLIAIPHLNKIGEIKRTFFWAIVAAGLLILLVEIRNLLVMGPLLPRLIYPSFTVYQYISIATFIERLEPLVVISWVMGIFVKLSICLYVAAKSLAAAFRGKRSRSYLFPISILMIEFSRFIYDNNTETIQFATNVWQWYSLPFQLLIPLLMLITAFITKAGRKHA